MATVDKIKVNIVNNQRKVKIPTGLRMIIRRCCHATLVLEGFEGSATVDVSIVDDEQIRELNATHRHIDRETDVLSFPLGVDGVYDIDPETGAKLLGDIVISMPRAVEQAASYGHSLQREVGYLTTHSMLHLLGYDHEQGGIDAVRMREKEEDVMMRVGLPHDKTYILTGEG